MKYIYFSLTHFLAGTGNHTSVSFAQIINLWILYIIHVPAEHDSSLISSCCQVILHWISNCAVQLGI